MLNIIIILIILMFGVVGFKNGIFKEGVSFIGTIIVFFISFLFKGMIGNVLCKLLPFFTFGGNLKGLVSINILVYQLIGFFILFSILMIAYHILMFATKILQKIVDLTIILTLPSKILGGIIGLFKGYLIMFIILLVLMLPFKDNELFTSSSFADYILNHTIIISSYTNDLSNTIEKITDLTIGISKGSIDTNSANLQIIDTMLKYGIVDAHTIDQLVVLDKLDSIKNLDSVLDNYK